MACLVSSISIRRDMLKCSSACRPRVRCGFTLIEMLVVIATLSLLIALLLPALQQARQTAQSLSCLSMIRQFQMASLIYAQDHQGYYVPAVNKLSDGAHVQWYNNTDYRALLNLPVDDRFVPVDYVCPAASYALAHPQDGGEYEIWWVYGFNVSGITLSGGSGWNYVGYRESDVRRPSELLAAADAVDWLISQWHSDEYTGEDFVPALTTLQTAYRHQDGANVAYFDGHAEHLPRKQMDVQYLNNRELEKIWEPLVP